MNPLNFLVAALAVSLFTACRVDPAPNASATGQTRMSPAGLEIIPLTIESGGRTHRFMVEVAASFDEQARGLMFRDSIGRDEGMLFPQPFPQPASFWMKNTLIPLDIIFIRPDGTIASIGHGVPHRLEPVTSLGEPVIATLELRGGRAAELGIQPGDRVSWFPGDAPPIMKR